MTEGARAQRDGPGAGHERMVTAVLVLVFALFFGELGALVYWAGGSVVQRLGFVLGVIGVYSIGIGFLTRTEFASESDLEKDMTSSNLRSFVAANLALLGVVFLIFSLAVRGQRSVLGFLFTAALVAPLFTFVAVYLLVVIPFAYVAHLLVSPITAGIIASPEEITIAGIGQERVVGLKAVIAEHEAAFKSFLVGVPAALFGLVSTGLSVLT